MASNQIIIMATIIAYLGFVILTGVMIGRRSKKSSEGFYLGGRGVGPTVTAMSAEASMMSSMVELSYPFSVNSVQAAEAIFPLVFLSERFPMGLSFRCKSRLHAAKSILT